MKREHINSVVFRKYSARTWGELEAFAAEFGFRIVDRMKRYDMDTKGWIPVIEVY